MAVDRLGVLLGGDGNRLEAAGGEAEKFELPRVAIDDEKLADVDLGIEVNFFSAAVPAADDFDSEVRAAEPVGVAVFGGVAVEEDEDIGDAIILCPIDELVRDVGTREDAAKASKINNISKNC